MPPVNATLGVPALMVRSVTPDHTGMPVMSAGGFITSHTSPIKDRWGGWYVTGKSGIQRHMGNAVLGSPEEDDHLPITGGHQNVESLNHFFDTGAYLSPHSDIVAFMTLEHQTQMVNLITRAGWLARLGEPGLDKAIEDLIDYMTFKDETPLKEPIKGTSTFAADFEAAGPLRQFDLKTRMFRVPLSYLVRTEQFKSLPKVVKDRVRLALPPELSTLIR